MKTADLPVNPPESSGNDSGQLHHQQPANVPKTAKPAAINPAIRPAPVKGRPAPTAEINTVNAILRRVHAPREHGTGGEVEPAYLAPITFTVQGELQAEFMGGDRADEFILSDGPRRESFSAAFYRKVWESAGKPGDFDDFLTQIEYLQSQRENCLHLGHAKITVEFAAVQD